MTTAAVPQAEADAALTEKAACADEQQNGAQKPSMPVERFLFQTGHLVRRLRGYIKKEDFTRLSAMSTLIAETSAAFSAGALSEAARNLSETAHTGDVQKLYAALQTVEKEFADFKTAGAACMPASQHKGEHSHL